jgi:16S rRNA (guanine527-N7)-methyltransferase
MQLNRIAELLQPFLSPIPCHSERPHREESAVLTAAQVQHISTYIDLLLRWNARVNLTAIRNEEEIVTRHFGESFFIARHLFPAAEQSSASRLADLGSGAGFPGIPIKLWAPNIALTLIESNHKKATFLREVTRILMLADVDIQNVRAETLPAAFDVATLRAVERFSEILPVAAGLLAPGGRLALLIGASQAAIARSTLPTFAWEPLILIPESKSSVLLMGTVEP